MMCTDCMNFDNCGYEYDYFGTDYAEDCMGYMTPEIAKLYTHCDKCSKADECKIHLNNPNVTGCKQ